MQRGECYERDRRLWLKTELDGLCGVWKDSELSMLETKKIMAHTSIGNLEFLVMLNLFVDILECLLEERFFYVLK